MNSSGAGAVRVHIAADGTAIVQRHRPARDAVAEFRHEGGTSFDRAPSFSAYIGAVAESLEMGCVAGTTGPSSRTGRLDWEVVLHG